MKNHVFAALVSDLRDVPNVQCKRAIISRLLTEAGIKPDGHEIALPVLEQQGGWISCSERMPDTAVDVIISDGINVGQGRIDIVRPAGVAPGHPLGSPIGFFCKPDPWGESRCNPIAWQPLPKPPKTDTTPQIDNDDWIEWCGGDCPVGDHDDVEVKFRDGVIEDGLGNHFVWGDHNGIDPDGDIIAYRVIENDGSEE